MTHDLQPKISRLEIRSYRTRVHLGVPAEERATPQEVEFDVLIQFTEEPLGAKTDRLEGTICYDELCQAIEKTCQAHPFQLIEALGRETYFALRQIIQNPSTAFQVRVHKLRPPIEGLLGGAHFTYGDAVK